MENFDIYKDIAQRTHGDIYIGVVGPVRTGKSTFIKRFMDLLVLPNIENDYSKERARDELPQSAAGKTIMTTEPKFIPNEAVEITLDDVSDLRVRLIDCVGYLVPGAVGHEDEAGPRMVNTPWNEAKIPFAQAAEIGTRKVIHEHSTIGILITTDGSITEIPRHDYEDAEMRVVNELKAINKPFVIVLNTTKPYAPEATQMAADLFDKYGIPVVPLNCAQLKGEDITAIMEKILYEFPLRELKINLPKWLEPLAANHWVKQSIIGTVKAMSRDISRLRQIKGNVSALEGNEHIRRATIERIAPGTGSGDVEITLDPALFYKVLSETTGMEIESEHQLISTITLLSAAKREHDKIKNALEEVKFKGYGIVTPGIDEMKLDPPQIVKHGSRYGVKIRASAPSLHIIQANIQTEISPIVGTEKESQDLVDFFNQQMEEDPNNIWELNMFGKSMHHMVKDGLQNKLYRMPEEAQQKLQEGLQKIVNEGGGRFFCILF